MNCRIIERLTPMLTDEKTLIFSLCYYSFEFLQIVV